MITDIDDFSKERKQLNVVSESQVLCFRGTHAAVEGEKNTNIRRDRSIIAHLIPGLVKK